MTATVQPEVIRRVYSPRGAARALLKCRDPEVLIVAGAGTGKSRACLEKIHMCLLLTPGARALVVRKTRESLTSTGLVTFREHVAAEAIEKGIVRWYGGSPQEPAQYRYSNGSRLVVGGMDKATKIMSSEYDLIFVQEATELSLDDWELLNTRLRNGKLSFQQLIADCNPDRPWHWLKQRCDQGLTTMLISRHEDNPVLFASQPGAQEPDTLPGYVRTTVGRQYMSKLDALTGVRKARLRYGQWAAADGLVYDGFEPSLHLVDKLPKGSETWRRWWSIDFGFTNPFVWQCWAEDPDGRLWLYREIYRTQTLVEQHAAAMMRAVTFQTGANKGAWREPKPDAIVCDHDAEGRATLEKHLGMSTTAANKVVPIPEGCQLVSSRLALADDGTPRMFLVRTALFERDQALLAVAKPTCTADEFAGYIWDTANGKKIKEVPVKEDDHGMDALRYIVVHRDFGSGRYFRGWIE